MNDNINNKILEHLKNMDIEENKKEFVKEVLDFEYQIGNQSKPKFSTKYRELVNKYI